MVCMLVKEGLIACVWVHVSYTVGMQACGDVMIGQHGQSVHEAIPHICGAEAILTSLSCFIIT